MGAVTDDLGTETYLGSLIYKTLFCSNFYTCKGYIL